jgi:hypothetical protein
MFFKKNLLLGAVSFLFLSFPVYASSLEISPSTFDYGWCPDNAKITATFTIKNTSTNLISLNSIHPACGCTAANFSRADLGSDKETTISLVFDTRGYLGQHFSKGTDIKAGMPEQQYHVVLKGHVRNPDALVFPEGTGIVHVTAENQKETQTVTLHNKSTVDVELDVIETPAAWVNARLSSKKIKAGQSTQLSVQVKGDASEDRQSSVTYEAKGNNLMQRLTLAFVSGQGPTAVRRIRPASKASPAPPVPSTSPSPIVP